MGMTGTADVSNMTPLQPICYDFRRHGRRYQYQHPFLQAVFNGPNGTRTPIKMIIFNSVRETL